MARRSSRSSVYNKRSNEQVQTARTSGGGQGGILPQAHAQSSNPTQNQSPQARTQSTQFDPWARATQFVHNVGRGGYDVGRSYTTDIADTAHAIATGREQEERSYRDETLATVFGRGLFEGNLEGSFAEASRRVQEQPGRVVGEVATETAIMLGTMGFGAVAKGAKVGMTGIKSVRGATKAKGSTGWTRKTGLIRKGQEQKFIGDKTTTIIKTNRKGKVTTRTKKTSVFDRMERFGAKGGERFNKKIGRPTTLGSPMIIGASGRAIDAGGKAPNLGLGNDFNIISKARGTKLGAKDIPTESISDDIAATSTDGMTSLTPYTAPGWSAPVKQTFNEGASKSTGSFEGVEYIKNAMFIDKDGMGTDVVDIKNIKEYDSIKAGADPGEWDARRLVNKKADTEQREGRGGRQGLEKYWEKRIGKSDLPETNIAEQNIQKTLGDTDGPIGEALFEGNTYESLTGAAPIAEDITKDTVFKKIQLSLLKSQGEGDSMILHQGADTKAESMFQDYLLTNFKQQISTKNTELRLAQLSDKAYVQSADEIASKGLPLNKKIKKRINFEGKEVGPNEEGTDITAGFQQPLKTERLGMDPGDLGLDKSNVITERTTNPKGVLWEFWGRNKDKNTKFADIPDKVVDNDGVEWSQFYENPYSDEGKALLKDFVFPLEKIKPGDMAYGFGTQNVKKRRFSPGGNDSVASVRKRYKFWQGRQYTSNKDAVGNPIDKNVLQNVANKDPAKDLFSIDDYRYHIEGIKETEKEAIDRAFDTKFLKGNLQGKDWRQTRMNTPEFLDDLIKSKIPEFDSLPPSVRKGIAEQTKKTIAETKDIPIAEFMKKTNQNKEQINRLKTFRDKPFYDPERYIDGLPHITDEYDVINKLGKVKKEYNTKPMGGKGEKQFDYGDTIIPWKQVKPSGRTQIIPNPGVGNNPIFGLSDPAARKAAIKAAKAERKRILAKETARRASAKKTARGRRTTKGKSRTQSGGTFADLFNDITGQTDNTFDGLDEIYKLPGYS